ncbi:MAG TPA: SulP family inorganic anion transporter [Gemmatimonadales bacterium]|nr:SulP family inorganic anion transporter [Gemmatimonadales bacterium]
MPVLVIYEPDLPPAIQRTWRLKRDFRGRVLQHPCGLPTVFVPKLVTTLKGYTRDQFFADATAGVIVGIVALPLAIAFAIASGVSPERGLITAIVAGFIISALGGSRVQIGGPTGAFVVIVYGIVEKYGLDGLTVATILAGFILLAFGFGKLGSYIRFIPFPVVIGFTSGIALIILSSQVKDFLGLQMGAVPSAFLAKWGAFGHALGSLHWPALLVSGSALLIIVVWPRINRRIPGPFIALVVTTVVVHYAHLDVETIATRFGGLSTSLPAPHVPVITLQNALGLVGPAFTIAMLAAIESLLSAVVSDGMIGGKHRSNMELVAQGVANIVSPLFGGIPATGAIARTATNVKNGARTPVAGIIHAVTLLLITLFFGRWAGLIPLATLAAILVVVAYHMSEWRTFVNEFRAPKSDVIVMVATFSLTVLVDLTVAIEVGMVLAAFLFMKRMSEVANVSVVTGVARDEAGDDVSDPNAVGRRRVPAGVEVYEVDGPFFFGAAEQFKETLSQVASRPKVLILRLRGVPVIDSTGLHALKDVVLRSRREGTLVLLSDVHAQPMAVLARSALLDQIGENHLLGNLDDALNVAREYLGLPTEERPAYAEPTVARETPARGTKPGL